MSALISLLILCGLQLSPAVLESPDGRPALPDTSAFRAELAAFAELSATARARQAAVADGVVAKWLPDFQVADGEFRVGLDAALGRQCFKRVRTKFPLMATVKLNVLGEAVADFEEAVVADPTHVPLRVALGLVKVQTGLPREGIDHLAKALLVSDSYPTRDPDLGAEDPDALRDYLRETAWVQLAFGYRDLGRWPQAMQAVDEALALRNSPVARVLKGLCLAGAEETAAAMTHAINMPPLKFRRVSGLSGGIEPRASAFANEWIKSQALFAVGDLDGANHVLGELERRYFQRMPLAARFWQDAALIAELRGDPETAIRYGLAGAGAFMGFLYPSNDSATAPIVLGFPARKVPYFVTSEGGFEGGSPFGYIAEQMNIMSGQGDHYAAEQARVRALDLCDALLARGVQSDLVHAFRGRVYMVTDLHALAHQDLTIAQAGFASRQVVDPGTSILLGQLELLNGRNARSEELFREALAAVPDNALAWRELGIALDRAGQHEMARRAMDWALELEPESMEGWYNLGVLAHRQGAHDEALRCLEKAWALQPGEPRIQQMLQTVATAQRVAID
jgi:tetratricopeptide (TPR) repeat protein